MAQLLHMHFVFFTVFQNLKTLFSKSNMPVYAWKIFLENNIEMVLIIPRNRESEAQTFRKHHNFETSYRTQWKQLVFVNERVSCIHVWQIPFSVVPIYRTVHQKNESWIGGSLCPERIKSAPLLSVRESLVMFHCCSVYLFCLMLMRKTFAIKMFSLLFFFLTGFYNRKNPEFSSGTVWLWEGNCHILIPTRGER